MIKVGPGLLDNLNQTERDKISIISLGKFLPRLRRLSVTVTHAPANVPLISAPSDEILKYFGD